MSAYRGLPQVLAFLLILSGCGKPVAPAPKALPKLSVVATVYPLADIAKQVAGDLVQCDWIAEQGRSLDATDPTPQVMEKVRSADVVLCGGAEEEWATAGANLPLRAKSIVRLDVLPAARNDSGMRQLWLDPAVAKDFARDLAERLVSYRPVQAAAMRSSAQQFGREIDAMLSELSPQLDHLHGKKVLVLSPDYSALLRALGMISIRPVTTTPLRLTDDDMRALRAAVQTEQPAALLVEVGLPLAVQQDLHQRLGIPVVTIDSLGTSAGVGRNTYQKILRYDLEQLITLDTTRHLD